MHPRVYIAISCMFSYVHGMGFVYVSERGFSLNYYEELHIYVLRYFPKHKQNSLWGSLNYIVPISSNAALPTSPGAEGFHFEFLTCAKYFVNDFVYVLRMCTA